MTGGILTNLVISTVYNWLTKCLTYMFPEKVPLLNALRGILLIIINLAYYPMMVVLPFAYVLARAYLVVECFINVSHLPAGAYKVPSWTAYFPHIA